MFITYYILAKILDLIDEKSKIYMNNDHFDIKQYYLIRLTKAGFNGDISFIKLYIYIYKVINSFIKIIKNLHPIASIFNIFNPGYPRILRVIDFTITVYLKIFFTFLPLSLLENQELNHIVKTRPISHRNFKGVNALELKIKEVKKNFIYFLIFSLIDT
jgi:hypothetical protein